MPKLKTTLASSGLLLPELSVLASASERHIVPEMLRKLVFDDNILSKPSFQSRREIWKKLAGRYKFDLRDNLLPLWWELIPQSESHDLAQLAVLRWAQFDLLLRFLWTSVYLPRKNMGVSIKSADVIDMVGKSKGASPAKRFFMECSGTVQLRTVQHFLLILRDCGGARGKLKKDFTPIPVGRNAASYAVKLARVEAPGSTEILNHWALRWWGDSISQADEVLRKVELST